MPAADATGWFSGRVCANLWKHCCAEYARKPVSAAILKTVDKPHFTPFLEPEPIRNDRETRNKTDENSRSIGYHSVSDVIFRRPRWMVIIYKKKYYLHIKEFTRFGEREVKRLRT